MPKRLSEAQLRILRHLATVKNTLSFNRWSGTYQWASKVGPRLNSRSVQKLIDLGLVKHEAWYLHGPIVITEAGRQALAEQDK